MKPSFGLGATLTVISVISFPSAIANPIPPATPPLTALVPPTAKPADLSTVTEGGAASATVNPSAALNPSKEELSEPTRDARQLMKLLEDKPSRAAKPSKQLSQAESAMRAQAAIDAARPPAQQEVYNSFESP